MPRANFLLCHRRDADEHTHGEYFRSIFESRATVPPFNLCMYTCIYAAEHSGLANDVVQTDNALYHVIIIITDRRGGRRKYRLGAFRLYVRCILFMHIIVAKLGQENAILYLYIQPQTNPHTRADSQHYINIETIFSRVYFQIHAFTSVCECVWCAPSMALLCRCMSRLI